jgi:AcrR family transcriptional regulator
MPPRPVDRSEKTARILKAAVDVFVRRGYRVATIEEIAERAGIGKGTVYLYFRSKDEILMAVFNECMDRMLGQMEGWIGNAEAKAADRLQAINDIALAGVDEMRPLFPLFFEFWAAAAGDFKERIAPVYRRIYDRLRKDIASVIEDGVRGGEFQAGIDAPAVASLWVGAVDGLGLQAWFEPSLDIHRLGHGFFRAILHGLVADRRGELEEKESLGGDAQ